jgi:predicted nucleotidyltransferase
MGYDILVEFEEPFRLFDFIGLGNELTRLLAIKVDLMMKDFLKPRLKDSVIKEAQNI